MSNLVFAPGFCGAPVLLFLGAADDRRDLHRGEWREKNALAVMARRDDEVGRADSGDDRPAVTSHRSQTCPRTLQARRA